MVSWLKPAWMQAFLAAAMNRSPGGMSSRRRRCSRSFAARSTFAVSSDTTPATLKVFPDRIIRKLLLFACMFAF
jgi:hypothetical protein